MKRRLMSVLLVIMLCAGMISPSLAAYTGYSDVPENHWSAASIRRATELGIFQGVAENVFGRGQAISRAAFVTALVRLFGWESINPGKATFTDVAAGKWYYSAVETAVANGAVAAAGKTFRPTEYLTRGEMAAMLMRALGYTSLAGMVSGFDCPFTDVTTNRGFITMAYDMGIVTGVAEGKFDPDTFATREQAATILVRVYDKLAAKNYEVLSAVGEELRVDTPAPMEGDELPTTPLEPISDLYTALRKMKESGKDMRHVTLCLTEGGVRTTSSPQGAIISSDTVSASEMNWVLQRSDVRIYYSERYESAYCVYTPNSYQTVTIWFQNNESLAVKLQLARLFGVTNYMFI